MMINIRMKKVWRKLTTFLKLLLLVLFILAAIIFIKVFLASISTKSNPNFTDGDLKIVMIDVGQGDSFLFLQNDIAMLVDCGPLKNYDSSYKILKKYNVNKLDYLVITHPHQDHAAGIFKILTGIRVDKILLTDMSTCKMNFDDRCFYLAFKSYVDAANFIYGDFLVEYVEPRRYKKGLRFSDSIIDFLAPLSDEYKKFNDYSLVMKLSYGDIDILMTGDAERTEEYEILDSGADIQSDIYKAAHHGSLTSNSRRFLDEVKPSYVMISSDNGNGNNYGHPKDVFMTYLEQKGITVFRTDESGTIEIQTDGKKIFFKEDDVGDYKSGKELIRGESD